MSIIKKAIKDVVAPIRGAGFPGGGRQRQRTKQIEIFKKLGINKFFIEKYPELLRCNQSYIPVASKIDVSKDIENFFIKTKKWMNYADQVTELKDWIDADGHDNNNPHPAIKHVVDHFKELKPESVCDIGAGAGVVSKYIYAANNFVNLTCIEGSDAHIKVMKENFDNNDTLPPKINVNAKIIKAIAQKLPFKDNSFDFVFTCTVMMHMPYIASVLAACEMARVSSKYVLHVEGAHVGGVPKNMRSKYNSLLLDYDRLYDQLGYKTVKKFYYQDPYATEYDYVV